MRRLDPRTHRRESKGDRPWRNPIGSGASRCAVGKCCEGGGMRTLDRTGGGYFAFA
jgi:hypothetical protein